MMGKSLFQRFFWRYLITLLLALALLIFITHWYQARHIKRQYRSLVVRAEAVRESWQPESAQLLANEWQQEEDLIRLLIVDNTWKILADSHPERGHGELALLRNESRLHHALTVDVALDANTKALLIRPFISRFPTIFQPEVPWMLRAPLWRLVAVLLAIAIIISLVIYPLVRKLRRTFEQLGNLAGEVAAGHFGKEIAAKSQDELGGLVNAFNHMSRQLAEAEKLNRRLIHDVSHELRSPLGRIRVLADTLRFRPESSESCVEEIHREVALLDRVVEDMVQAARMEASSAHLKFEPLELVAWGRVLTEKFTKVIKAKGAEAAFELPAESCEVQVDRQRLTQAVSNLVENALVAVTDVAQPRVQIGLNWDETHWWLWVSDNGVGIPAEDQPFVFRRFYRVGEHRNRDEGGVGLGLSIVKAIVASHQGNIELHSEADAGTRVTMTFPRFIESQSNIN